MKKIMKNSFWLGLGASILLEAIVVGIIYTMSIKIQAIVFLASIAVLIVLGLGYILFQQDKIAAGIITGTILAFGIVIFLVAATTDVMI